MERKREMPGYTFDESVVSDLYKEVYGFRPSQAWWDSWNLGDNVNRQKMWDELSAAHDVEMELYNLQRAAAVKSWNDQVESNLKLGASDRETAVRWIVESLQLDVEDLRYGFEYISYKLDLPFELADRDLIESACKTLSEKEFMKGA